MLVFIVQRQWFQRSQTPCVIFTNKKGTLSTFRLQFLIQLLTFSFVFSGSNNISNTNMTATCICSWSILYLVVPTISRTQQRQRPVFVDGQSCIQWFQQYLEHKHDSDLYL